MSTTGAPLDEYLRTSYSPDREYVDGVVVECNGGEKPHSKIQRNLIVVLPRKFSTLHVWPELRMRTLATRYCIPDVSVTLVEPATGVLQGPPYVAIEVLSPEDRMGGLLAAIRVQSNRSRRAGNAA